MSDDEYTPESIAQWMLDQLTERPRLYQETVVRQIRNEFGEEWSYRNANGNWAIDKRVLAAFRRLSDDDVIWERGDRAWRRRREHDKPGRQQY